MTGLGNEVYADLYFLVNASMDLLCLLITSTLLHRRTRRWRALLGAALGGVYAVAALVLEMGGAWGLLCDAAAALAVCGAVFAGRGSRPSALLQAAAVFALTSVLMGGVMTALFAWLNRLQLPLESLQGDGLSVWMFALLAAVSGVLTLRGGRFLGRSRRTRSVTLLVTLFGKTVSLRAMVDSGNLLRDPVSGRSVIVVEREKLRPVLPPAFFREGRRWIPDHDTARRVRLIPAQTATGPGMLTAFLPEALTVTDRHGSLPSDYLLAPVELGGRAQGFDALIPAD